MVDPAPTLLDTPCCSGDRALYLYLESVPLAFDGHHHCGDAGGGHWYCPSRPSSGTQLPEWNIIMATAILALLPPVLVILVLQRWFVQGLVEGEK